MTLYENENRQLTILPEAEMLLDVARKWAKFLAILGFIFCGVMVLFGVVFSLLLDNLPGQAAEIIPNFVLIVLYIILAAIYFFPSLYLYRFALRARQALLTKDSAILIGSFDSLRDCFRYLGIISIIVLILYGIGFIIGIGSMIFFGSTSSDTFL